MCHEIRCDGESKKIYKISHELNKTIIYEIYVVRIFLKCTSPRFEDRCTVRMSNDSPN
jgi:hypothetical protein